MIFDDLLNRGLVKQITNTEKIRHLLDNEKITFYIGFDPTSDSLHVGHLLQLITAKRLSDAGHKAILLIGGATALIGDPTGKSDMRKMLDSSQVQQNTEAIEAQMRRIIKLPFKTINNIRFHSGTNWMQMLREIGPFFSVNNMLRADCFKSRMEAGLTFLEFNYMILQAKDFHVLNISSGDNCVLQIGGDDQWSNILAGIDLIHKKEKREAFGLTLPLLLNSDGTKMGKTEKGAIWLDPDKTSVFDFFQFWRNIPDTEVVKCLKFLTFWSLEQINETKNSINDLKKHLAFEVTKIVHGEDAAVLALMQAEALFESRDISALEAISIVDNIHVLDLIVMCDFARSRTEARNLINGRGITINDKVLDNPTLIVTSSQFGSNLTVKKGKKNFCRFIIKETHA